MARARIDETAGRDAVLAVLASGEHPDRTPPDRTVMALAVRYLLQTLAEASPGKSVEVRVPPFGAVQAVEGPKHTRGTPPNVVELDPPTFLAIATGGLDWASAVAAGRVHASGARSDLSGLFPLAY
ncbi:MAG: sterol carrier family protein [Yonghaparkia sp.]|nr:sterol carrier family protein [Microcella sp.]